MTPEECMPIAQGMLISGKSKGAVIRRLRKEGLRWKEARQVYKECVGVTAERKKSKRHINRRVGVVVFFIGFGGGLYCHFAMGDYSTIGYMFICAAVVMLAGILKFIFGV